MSSKFHVFQLWCTKCSRAGTAAFRNTPNIVCSKYWRDSETVGGTADELSPKYWHFQDPPQPRCPKYWTAESLSPTESLSPKYWQFRNAVIAMPTMRFSSTGRSQTVEGTAESLSPKYGHFQNHRTASRTTPRMPCPKYCRDSEPIDGAGDSLSPKPQCFAPSTGGIQNQSKAWGNRFFPRVLAVPGPTVKVFSSSTGTELRTIQTNHGSGHAGVRGGRFRDVGLRGALRGKKYGVCQGE